MRRDPPDPPTNPPEPEFHHDAHDYRYPDSELDGVGMDEANSTEYNPFVVIHHEYSCVRDGCDATKTERALFAAEDAAQALKLTRQLTEDDEIELWESARIVDHNVVQVTDPETGTTATVNAREVRVDDDGYACTGAPPR